MPKSLVTRAVDCVPEWVASGFRSDSVLARAGRPILNRIVGDEETVVTVRSGPGKGLALPVMPGTEKYYWSGAHEQHVQEAMAGLLKPGMNFWDVGAHIGFFTVIAARLVGDSGRVLAFEPMPETRTRLRESIRLNHLNNVTVNGCALGDDSGVRTLQPPRLDRHGAGAAEGRRMTLMWTLDEERGDGEGVRVDCRRLDDMLEGSDPPDLIKVDAEGVEIEVLAGGLGLLEGGPAKVIVEMSDAETLERGRRLLPNHRFELIGANHWLLSPA